MFRITLLAWLAASVTAALSLGGCAAPSVQGHNAAQELAIRHDFRPLAIDAGPFLLRGYLRTASTASAPRDLVVYIQGDGRPYSRRDKVADNPTPASPLAFALAVQDPAPAVAYLARPCQFVAEEDVASWRSCVPADWTVERYGPRALAAMDRGLDVLKAAAGAARLHLVGHSGGGSMAALLAARRQDVAALVTVAANLDHAAWTAHHGVTPLHGSLNAADAASALRELPQLHFQGARDVITPAALNSRYFEALGEASCLEIHTAPMAGHGADWIAGWRERLAARESLDCYPAIQ